MKMRTALVAALAATALTACGTTDAPTDAAPEPAGSGAAAITVTDARGKEVTLDAPATDVVTLEWSSTDYVTTLGVQPVGVADVDGYGLWSSAGELGEGVTDVGVRTEPSIESVAGLEPDLILADEGSIPEDAMEQMERIAPVVVLKGATADGLVELVKSNQATVGTLLGKEAEAEQLAADFDATVEQARATIASAGKEGTPFVLTYPYAEANSITFRVHAAGSSPSAVGELIGLTDAWSEAGDPVYGLASSDVEGLTNLPDDTEFLYWVDSTTEDPVETVLADNAVWTGLPFVEAGRVHPAADGIWLYGGTVSLGQLAQDIATEVTSD
ncbi:ABC transporter substrate-binding protein [Auraticoccus monumenti]|uniref:Iron complex transport system substrate-binding protein n=1 Tax=Auraticoccus monumenti TaxID=675864 RepID=A0A1G6SAF9_9ACTN|nr:iron-siderophore ABC transporter substrate-binding protein [Auraticoccus monumenti]SDD13661.1 iron complex transport system substrate-binding protein [Auraticoccus monumenti]